MEHRFADRKPLRLDVELFHRDELLGRFTTRDINEGGVFIETGALGLHRNEVMTISFVTDRPEDQRPCHLKAMVVHQSGEGAGMMFFGGDSQSLLARRALADLAA